MLDLSVDVQAPFYVSPGIRLVHNVADLPGRASCGHSFCLECILGWLSVQLGDFRERNPGFILDDHTIDILKNPLSDPDGFVEAVKMAGRRYPRFTCPACRSVMTKRPVPLVIAESAFADLCVWERHGVEVMPPAQLDRGQVNHLFERYLLF